MSEVEYLDLEDLLGMVRALGLGPVRDIGLLDSAAVRARSSAFGADAYESIDLKAAALLHSLARDHALADGNERLAWLAAVVFLDLNGCEAAISADEAFGLVIDLASCTTSDLDEIAARLRSTARQS